MNERIDELMIQAGARFEMMNWVHYDDFEYKKFAELIIKDFYNICDQAWDANERNRTKEGLSIPEQMVLAGAQAQCQKMKENIKELFGVEE